MKNKITSYLKQVSKNFELLENQNSNIEKAATKILEVLRNNNKVIFCGNGGSAADSQHLAAELMGRYKVDRDALPAISITVDTSAITAIGNDYGFDEVFSRQISGIGNMGDVLYATSTSGNSKNVVNAIQKAKEMGIFVISVTGEKDSLMSKNSDLCIQAPSIETNHIQEMHITLGQLICGIVEEEMFSKEK